MRMPDLDGPGFYREVGRRHPHLRSRVIFLTGDVLSAEGQAFFAQGARPRLVKPFKAEEVRQVIQQVLDGAVSKRGPWGRQAHVRSAVEAQVLRIHLLGHFIHSRRLRSVQRLEACP